MKTKTGMILLVIMSLFSLTAPAMAEREGHGGDPIQVIAKPYPQEAQLNEAIGIAKTKIIAVSYSNDFTARMVTELDALKTAGQYFLLPDIILLGPSGGDSETAGYTLPTDANTFISLGGMTETEVGAPVYLAQRVLSYSSEELAGLLAHEVAHHIIAKPLAANEDFVTDLQKSIENGLKTKALERAMTSGIYSDNGSVVAKEFGVAFFNAFFSKILISVLFHSDEPYSSADQAKALGTFLSSVPSDIGGTPLEDIWNALTSAAQGVLINGQSPRITQTYTFDFMVQVLKEINPAVQINSNADFCRVHYKWSLKGFYCPSGEAVLVREIFK